MMRDSMQKRPGNLTTRPLVIFDMDSTLWPFNRKLVQAMGLTKPMNIYYVIGSPELTLEQQKIAMQCFKDPDFYRDIEFYDGIEDLLRPEELGAEVRIETNSMSRAVSDLKPPQLLAAVRGLTPEHIHCHTLDSPQDKPKSIDPRVTVLVEDSPHTVAVSPAQMNVLMRISWNSSAEGVRVMMGKRVRWFGSLREINDYVYRYLLAYIENKPFENPPRWR